MQAVILALAVISFPSLVASTVLGYMTSSGTIPLGTHINVSLAATMIVMLSHTITVFYFVGTGSAIERETRERGLDRIYVDDAKRFKRALFPWALLAIFLTMTTAMLGGGVHVQVLSPAVHRILAILTLICNGIALWRVPGSLIRNNQLLDAVATASAPEVSQEDPPK